jgi:hypothetical protein
MDGFGKNIERGFYTVIIVAIVVTGIVVGGLVWWATR